jgi:hypothetical protein
MVASERRDDAGATFDRQKAVFSAFALAMLSRAPLQVRHAIPNPRDKACLHCA